MSGQVRFPLPDLGARVPGWTPRAAFAVIALVLCWVVLPSPPWFFAGVGLTTICVLVVWSPVPVGLLLLGLGASLLWQQPGAGDAGVYLLLAGLHALLLLGTGWLPVRMRAWIQLSALVPTARRFLIVQIPSQAFAFVVLTLLAPLGGTAGSTAIIGGIAAAAALVALALVVIAPMARGRR